MCGKAPASFLKLLLCARKKVGGNLEVWTFCFISLRAQEEEGHPDPAWPSSTGCGLPGSSAEWRLKTKLPAGCSVAWRYHRGKWSMVNMLALSSGVRNFLQRERLGSSLQIWGCISLSLLFHRQLYGWAKRMIPLCFGGLAGTKYELLVGGAPDNVPRNSCLFQSQMSLHLMAH